MNSNYKWGVWLFVVGLLVVLGTHIYTLVAGLPPEQMVPHAIFNLIAACLLAGGWIAAKLS